MPVRGDMRKGEYRSETDRKGFYISINLITVITGAGLSRSRWGGKRRKERGRMAETGAITAYLKDIAVLEDEAERRMKVIYGEDCDVRAHRTEFLKFRKDILHEIISRSKYGRKK